MQCPKLMTILNHQSKIIPNEETTGFSYSDDLIPSDVVTSISVQNNVASRATHEHQRTSGENSVSRNTTEARSLINDTTSSIKVILFKMLR